MKKIAFFTATRAEFGFFIPLLKRVESTEGLEYRLIVSGTHLAPGFGKTIDQIEGRFKIDKRIEMLLDSDSGIGAGKSMALTQISLVEALDELDPDILLVAGDRYESLTAASSATLLGVPVAHFSGGELTFGSIDDPIRHAITKLSHLHFTATQAYRKRVIQMGEAPQRVFNVGEIGLENIENIRLLSKEELQKRLGLAFKKRNLIVTFHPETVKKDSADDFKELLFALKELQDTLVILTRSNADAGGRKINEMIDRFVSETDFAVAFTSLGQQNYLSALQYVDAVVGNSSSGIIEAPSFKTATINIGERQRGRVQAESIINAPAKKDEILSAIKTIYSDSFREKLQKVKNPYEKRGGCDMVIQTLLNHDLNSLIPKGFYDIDFKLPNEGQDG